jgi:hypothetical protein
MNKPWNLLRFMQDQLANDETTTDEEMAQHLAGEGVPEWLARFYIARHRDRARREPMPNFEEANELVDACVHIALGYAEDKSLLDDYMLPHAEVLSAHVHEILLLLRVRDVLRDLGLDQDNSISESDALQAIGEVWKS